MSDLQENEIPVQVTKNSPGKRLRKAREGCSLSRKDIAERLHLSEKIIDAIERDDQDNLPAPAFVRGYLRGYAPLVSLDADLVVADYNHYFADSVDSSEIKDTLQFGIERKRTGKSGIGKIKMYLVLVLFVLVGIGYFAEQESTDDISSEQESAITVNSKNNLADTGADLVDSNSVQTQDSGLSYQASESNSGNQQKQQLSGSLGSGSNQEKNAEKIKESYGSSSWDDSDLLDGSGEVFPSPEPGLEENARFLEVGSLSLQFHADAWTEVHDANGERLLYRLGREGKTYRVSGAVPFKVLLGNAKEVTVMLNGRMFDQTPFIRGQVARFSVSEKSVGEKSTGAE
ncbi:MAG: helix-turn-helix domain-containing protein [Gammaproteobacteria bacterium]|nr:helix-turn-helix domain-containing protein [Gammaproteobacteria bacterium]